MMDDVGGAEAEARSDLTAEGVGRAVPTDLVAAALADRIAERDAVLVGRTDDVDEKVDCSYELYRKKQAGSMYAPPAVREAVIVEAADRVDVAVADAEHEGMAQRPTTRQPGHGHAVGAPEPAGQ